ncbi:Lead, cadmium, zinc and mercury-transporting ATPase [invertebrate metagenome]|uniref:Lead, cadmium, zinc and mercury-transporting ATPase n=1 Tax=invertebrate metagenome TaxID=1711999 RepID=A0A2H9TA01_9ZZZZ
MNCPSTTKTPRHPNTSHCGNGSSTCLCASGKQAETALPHLTSNHQKTFCWLVKGMDCPACSTKLEKSLSLIPGIQNAKVAFATEKLTVLTDPIPDIDVTIKQAAHNSGFSLQDLNTTKKNQEQGRMRAVLKRFFDDKDLMMMTALLCVAGLVSIIWPSFRTTAFSIATVWGLIPILQQAFRLAKNGSPFSIETLMGIAAIGALFLGESAESAMVLFLFMLGEQLESLAAGSARKGVKNLMALAQDEALLVRSDGQRRKVRAETLQKDDTIDVLPGSRMPADGVLLSTSASFDESALTGESLPVEHTKGEAVMAGILALGQVARVKVSSEPGHNTVDRIIKLIEEAEQNKAPVERFIDRFSRWYTPSILIFAALTATIPPLFLSQSPSEWIYRALTLLLIGCPCALVISTPAAVTSALSVASRLGILVKGGAALEKIGHASVIAFDKTGTLTQGRPTVHAIKAFNRYTPEQLLSFSAAIEVNSTHPLAHAIVAEYQKKQTTISSAQNIVNLPGSGIQGFVNQNKVAIISPRYGSDQIQANKANDALSALEKQGCTVAIILINDQLAGLIAFQDTIKEEAPIAISSLAQQGVHAIMLTGDNATAASAVAKQLNMDFKAGLLPDEKLKAIISLRQHSAIAMVGDGINDAPAMKQADVGIAMGNGSDIALETADCALIHNRVNALPELIALSRTTLSKIHQNIAIALGFKALFLITTLMGLTGLWLAVIADTGTMALVTANALRLLRFGHKKQRF